MKYQTALALTLVLLASCDHAPIGIFAGIEQEERIEDERNLPNGISINAIIEFDNYYYVSASTVYRRLTANQTGGKATEWGDPLAAPAGYPRALRLALLGAADSGTLYGVFTTDDASNSALFSRGVGATAWTEVTLPAEATASGTERVSVLEAGGRLFLQISAGRNDYRLFATSDGTTFTEVQDSDSGADLSSPTPFTDIAYDGTDWWLVSLSRFVTSSAATPANTATAVADHPTAPISTGFGGIFYGGPAGQERLYLAGRGGRIFVYDPLDTGAGWTGTPETEAVTVSDKPVPFTDFDFLTGSDGFSTIVVGTDGYGYYEVEPTTVTIAVPSRDGNYQASALSAASVLAFYVDGSPDLPSGAPAGADLMFVGTSGLGLWKNYYEGNVTNWTRE